MLKLLSEDPANYADAPREGIRRILEEVGGPLAWVHLIPARPTSPEALSCVSVRLQAEAQLAAHVQARRTWVKPSFGP